MNGNFSEILKALRRERGENQEALAERFGISIQAVSKWENAQSYPDIELLPEIAAYYDVSIDFLLTGRVPSGRTSRQGAAPSGQLPDDGVLRIVQYLGARLLTRDEYDPETRIMLELPDDCPRMKIEIWGSADIEGDIGGEVSAGNSITCGDIEGSVSAGNSVTCGDVEGEVSAGNSVACGDVGDEVSAGNSVACGNVEGEVSAGGGVTCANVEGDVTAGSDVICGNVEGDVTAGGIAACGDVGGNVSIR